MLKASRISTVFLAAVCLFCAVASAQERIMITAHAGSCGTPANTVESLIKAVSVGVDFVEMDVRQCPDGSLGIKHDVIKDGEHAASLRDALLAVKPSECRINLDIKESRVMPKLYELLQELQMTDRVIMTGVAPEDILKAREQMPGVPYYPAFEPSITLVSDPEYAGAVITFLKATGSEGINCNFSHVTPELSELLRNNSLKLSVWTVDKESEMHRIISLCPYNITTRHPDTVKSLISE